MHLSDVKVRLISKPDSKLKAVASIILENCFVVHDIKIIQGNDGLFIAMPSRKTPDGEFKDIAHPLDSDTRNAFADAIIKAYETAVKALEN